MPTSDEREQISWTGGACPAWHRWVQAALQLTPVRFVGSAAQSGEVVGEVGQADLGFGANHTDGADDQAKSALLSGEDVFDTSAHAGARGITARHVRRQSYCKCETRQTPP